MRFRQISSYTVFRKKTMNPAWRLVILCCFVSTKLFASFADGDTQQKDSLDIYSRPVITLGTNALIYSEDESFNRQIEGEKIYVKDAYVKIRRSGSKDTYVSIRNKPDVTSFKTIPNAYTVKVLAEKVKAEIEDNKSYKKSYPTKQIGVPLNSNDFLTSARHNKIYYAPQNNNVNDSKAVLVRELTKNRKTFVHRLSNRFFYANNRSLGKYVVKDFTVRPPPP